MGESRTNSAADLVAGAGQTAARATAERTAASPAQLAELAELQVRSTRLVEGSPDGLIVVSPDGRLVVFNRAAEQLTGWNRDELRGNPTDPCR
jgi:PAS domain-containing protein